MKKIFKIVLFMAMFLSTFIYSFSQSKFAINFELYPYCIPSEGQFIKEDAIGYYAVNAKGKTGFYTNINLNYKLGKKIGIGAGIGYHDFNFETHFEIKDPFNETSLLYDTYRFFGSKTIGPCIEFEYTIAKLKLSIGYNYLYPIKVSKSHKSSLKEEYIFDLMSGETAYLRIDERILYGNVKSYSVFSFNIDYLILRNLYVSLGVEDNLSGGLPTYYSLLVDGDISSTSNEILTLNDFTFFSRYMAFKFGVVYRMQPGLKP